MALIENILGAVCLGTVCLPLAPGFSPVLADREGRSRFNGFSKTMKAAEAAGTFDCGSVTGLKPGANETWRLPAIKNL